ncbi:hypothetical protein PLUTE_a3360 [Pseudoalteromonas luteoviolacea DSM 6061]|nr:hypothetical protein [Pseudoalteromonas luteoviolacea DSM 6061]
MKVGLIRGKTLNVLYFMLGLCVVIWGLNSILASAKTTENIQEGFH